MFLPDSMMVQEGRRNLILRREVNDISGKCHLHAFWEQVGSRFGQRMHVSLKLFSTLLRKWSILNFLFLEPRNVSEVPAIGVVGV